LANILLLAWFLLVFSQLHFVMRKLFVTRFARTTNLIG
jgi:hypothetical protein